MDLFNNNFTDSTYLMSTLDKFLTAKTISNKQNNKLIFPDQKSINLHRARELKELMDDEFPTLNQTFIKNSDESLYNLKQNIISENSNEIIITLHNLKSAAQNMGAPILTDYLISFEQKIERCEIEAKDVDVNFLQLELSAIKSALNSFMSINDLT